MSNLCLCLFLKLRPKLVMLMLLSEMLLHHFITSKTIWPSWPMTMMDYELHGLQHCILSSLLARCEQVVVLALVQVHKPKFVV